MTKQFLSKCCSAEIEKRHGKFSPDESGFYIHTSYDCCSKCEDEYPDQVDQCMCCGEAAEEPIETKLGVWCISCVQTYSDELVERV